MIVFLHTASHRYTHRAVRRALAPVRPMSYEAALGRHSLPLATYVFTDLDRLGAWPLELAATLFRALQAAGCRVLNDPARVLGRLALLRRLARARLNSFDAWPASEADAVERFPVFVRTAAAHRGNLTDLLSTPAELAEAIERLVRDGYPLFDLIVVEYRAEPSSTGVFRKLSMYKVGDQLVPSPSVHQRHWMAKYGEAGVAGEEGYLDDLRIAQTAPYAQAVGEAFRLAGVDYGRADFGLVEGRPEIYEINTNPFITLKPTEAADAARRETEAISSQRFLEAVLALDSPPGGRVPLHRPHGHGHLPRRRRISPTPYWTP